MRVFELKIGVAFLLMAMMARSSASGLTSITVEGIEKKPIAYQAKHVAVFGRISMKFESTDIEACDQRKRSSKKFIDLILYDDVHPVTETQANQYFTNLQRYAPFDKKCGWVVGVFDTDNAGSPIPAFIGEIKMITYIGSEAPHGLN